VNNWRTEQRTYALTRAAVESMILRVRLSLGNVTHTASGGTDGCALSKTLFTRCTSRFFAASPVLRT
jgi:hypothetical protein